MRQFTSCALFAATLLLGLSAGVEKSQAQPLTNWGEDAGRALSPGAYVPFDGMPYYYRYNNPEGDVLLATVPNLGLMAQLDHQERLQKFGTRYTPDHPPLFNRLFDRLRSRKGERVVIMDP